MDTMNSSFTTVQTTNQNPPVGGTVVNSSATSAGMNQISVADMSASLSVASSGRPSSKEFSEQIKKLEMEGHKLREVTLASLAGNVSFDGTDSGLETGKTIHPGPAVAALIDISSEQKTISDLRSQLDQQRKETDRLQSQLLADLPPSHSFTSIPSSPGKSAFSTLPTNNDNLSSSTRNRAFEFVPPSHLERALKESQEQVSELRKRLQESNDIAENQKRQFRTNIEELKSKLHDTIVNRDTILELRQKESASQESVISKLKSSLQQQHEKNKNLESSLSDSNRKLETLTQSCYLTDTVVSQVKALLTEREKARGKPYFDSNPASSQGPPMLVHTLERCLQELETELDIKRTRLSDLQQQLEKIQSENSLKEQTLSKEYHDNLQRETEDALKRVTSLTSEHEKQLESANERATNARKQATALQNQLNVLQNQLEQQMKMKDELIAELELKVRSLKGELTDDRSKWHERREVMESSLEQLQRELASVKSDREERVRKCSVLETHLQDLQGSVSTLERELDTERGRIKKQLQREEELRSKLLLTENSLTGKQQDVQRLEKMLDVVKQECSSQMQDRIHNAEKSERERNNEQIQSLTAQLSSQTEKCNKVTVELELTRTEMATFKEQIKDLTEKLESARIQLEAAMSEKRHLSELVNDRKGDLERVSKEKDYYFNLLEQKNDELSRVKAEKERLCVQMDEKERNLLALKQQSDNISQLVEVNSRTSENIREEKERIIYLLNEKSAAVDELRTGQESMGKKLRLREKRIRDLEEERMKLTEELALKVQEMEATHHEKEDLFKELKDSRLEVATLTQAKEMMKKELSKQRQSYEKDVTKLQSKLKGAEHDLKLATKTLKSKDSIDNKAVRYADKMQKEITNKRGEVDTLQSKMRKYEDKLESLAKEKLMIERDNENLKKSLNKSVLHTQTLTAELEHNSCKNQELRDHIQELVTALEKASVKTSSSQAQLEQVQQQMAKLKIKHQLDLKEAEHFITGKSPQYSTSALPPSGRQSSENVPVLTNHKHKHTGKISQHSADIDDHKSSSETGENYTEVGHELKALLTEMRSLVAGQKEMTKKSNIRPSYRHSSPLQKRCKDSSPELDSLSDSEMEPSWSRSRPRSNIDFSGVSSVRETHSAPQTPQRRPRRSCSADLNKSRSKQRPDSRMNESSYLTSPSRSAYTGSPYRSNDVSAALHAMYINPSHSHSVSAVHTDTDTHLISPADSTPISLSPDIPDDEEFEPVTATPASLSPLTPDTQELCKRLEEKIENLTKMGGNLQRENREMANLMTVHGRRIDCVRESERKIRKSPR